jgi:glutamine amidotransferase
MCIAILTKPNIVLEDGILQNSAQTNKDGFGLSWIEGGNVEIFVTLDFNEFLKNYEQLCEQHPESPKLIHLRKKTEGSINLDNCHPFYVDEKIAFMHNGTIKSKQLIVCKGESDTSAFCTDFLQKLPPGWMKNDAIIGLITDFIGTSRVVFLSADPVGYLIINEKDERGHWDEKGEVWYSNYSYYAGVASIQYVKPHGDWRKKQKSGWDRRFDNLYATRNWNEGDYEGFNPIPGPDDDWQCFSCKLQYKARVTVCTCGYFKYQGFLVKESKKEDDNIYVHCKKCGQANLISSPNCCKCKVALDYPEWDNCSFCGKDQIVDVKTTFKGKEIILCRRCRLALEHEVSIKLPHWLFKKTPDLKLLPAVEH